MNNLIKTKTTVKLDFIDRIKILFGRTIAKPTAKELSKLKNAKVWLIKCKGIIKREVPNG